LGVCLCGNQVGEIQYVKDPKQATLEDVYQQFNQNELNSRTAFEIVYNECKNLRVQLQNVTAQNSKLIKEKSEWEKVKERTPEIKK